MPVCDGLSAARAVRLDTTGPNRNTPILALTASVTEEDRAAVSAAGMVSILPKPVTRDKMAKAVHQWIPGYGARFTA